MKLNGGILRQLSMFYVAREILRDDSGGRSKVSTQAVESHAPP
jgi:hypothetical protein